MSHVPTLIIDTSDSAVTCLRLQKQNATATTQASSSSNKTPPAATEAVAIGDHCSGDAAAVLLAIGAVVVDVVACCVVISDEIVFAVVDARFSISDADVIADESGIAGDDAVVGRRVESSGIDDDVVSNGVGNDVTAGCKVVVGIVVNVDVDRDEVAGDVVVGKNVNVVDDVVANGNTVECNVVFFVDSKVDSDEVVNDTDVGGFVVVVVMVVVGLLDGATDNNLCMRSDSRLSQRLRVSHA